MSMENHDCATFRANEAFEALKKIDLFAGIQRLAESTHFLERRCFTEDERTGSPSVDLAQHVPRQGTCAEDWMITVIQNGAPAGQAVSPLNGPSHIGEQFRTWVGIGVHEHQPVADGMSGTGIA